ncbi:MULTISPECIES: hypothetical protein [Streptomyces]|uniref:Uncharacterized protein n=2 Tax=Streptomyces TaxID=1883 RepID=A0A2U9PAP6_STRAS|nr:hypothetical protein [Streptomyces actuosus]AWT46647.1 hypothetical protein DMT42_33055 [Streptomyces actuosus]MBM4823369.1 hypothetical protein [Streptomyces actuosus]
MSDAPAGGIARGGPDGVAATTEDGGAGARETGRLVTAVLGDAPAPSPLSPERLRNTYRSMPAAERSALWRQRLHEAESGLTRLLAARPTSTHLADWFALQSEIFADLPDPTTGGSEDWQRVFFRGQALMERFLVARFGEQALAAWAQAIAEVHRGVEPDHGRGAADPVHRIARQAELYGSDYEFDDGMDTEGATRAALTITHCAIWDYREKARRSGVRLTLASPCTYCTRALSANIRAKGFEPSHSLRTGPTGHGCRWEATAPQQPSAEPSGER